VIRAVRGMIALLVAAGAGLAQTPLETANLLSLTDRLQAAIDAEDWTRAAELSRALRQATVESRNAALARRSEDQINAALGWLPTNTETVIVAKEAFSLDFNSRRGGTLPGALRLTQSYTLTPIASKAAAELSTKLEGQTLRFAVFAARRFQNRAPGEGNTAPHGLIAYQGCGLYGLARPAAGQILERAADESLMGYLTWTVPAGESRGETIFVAQPKPDLLLACNDRNFFSEMLARIDAPPRSRPFAQDGPAIPAGTRGGGSQLSFRQRPDGNRRRGRYRSGVRSGDAEDGDTRTMDFEIAGESVAGAGGTPRFARDSASADEPGGPVATVGGSGRKCIALRGIRADGNTRICGGGVTQP